MKKIDHNDARGFLFSKGQIDWSSFRAFTDDGEEAPIFVWNYSRTVNVFFGGENVDVFTFGDWSENRPVDVEEAMLAINEWLVEQEMV